MKFIAVIPARKGSKRIKNKNIINFYNKPLIAWTIESAIKSKVFDKIIVSTDSKKIASISENYGAEIPFLRDKYSDDNSTVSQVTVDALKNLNIKKGTVVQLLPNCPLRNKNDIILSLNNFKKKSHKTQLSCLKYGWMNPWWAHKKVKNKYVSIFPKALKKRSQDLNDLYCPTGAIWISDIEILLKYKTFYNPFHTFFPLSIKASIDIDDKDDLMMARSYFHIK